MNNIISNTTPERPVVVFDFDGTLMEGDAGKECLNALFEKSALRKMVACIVLLVLLPYVAIRPRHIFSKVGSLLLWVGTVGRSKKTVLKIINAVALKISDVEAHHRHNGEYLTFPSRAFLKGFEELRLRIKGGATCVIITGSPKILVRKVFANAAPDLAKDVRIIGSRLACGWGGVYTREHCFRERKLEMALAGGVPLGPWEACYTDSLTDLPLLLNSQQRFLVNASSKLLAQAKKANLKDFENVSWYAAGK